VSVATVGRTDERMAQELLHQNLRAGENRPKVRKFEGENWEAKGGGERGTGGFFSAVP